MSPSVRKFVGFSCKRGWRDWRVEEFVDGANSAVLQATAHFAKPSRNWLRAVGVNLIFTASAPQNFIRFFFHETRESMPLARCDLFFADCEHLEQVTLPLRPLICVNALNDRDSTAALCDNKGLR